MTQIARDIESEKGRSGHGREGERDTGGEEGRDKQSSRVGWIEMHRKTGREGDSSGRNSRERGEEVLGKMREADKESRVEINMNRQKTKWGQIDREKGKGDK